MPDPIQAAVAKLKIGTQSRHVFLCVGGKCASHEQGQASWEHLKRRLREAGLQDAAGGVLRTKADCLRICTSGPIAVVYPEGICEIDIITGQMRLFECSAHRFMDQLYPIDVESLGLMMRLS